MKPNQSLCRTNQLLLQSRQTGQFDHPVRGSDEPNFSSGCLIFFIKQCTQRVLPVPNPWRHYSTILFQFCLRTQRCPLQVKFQEGDILRLQLTPVFYSVLNFHVHFYISCLRFVPLDLGQQYLPK